MIERVDGPSDDGRTHYERMLAGDWYLADDPEIAEHARRGRILVDRFNATGADDDDERLVVLTELLGTVGAAPVVTRPFFCEYGTQLKIGDRFFANVGLVALDVASITIGDDVLIGPNVQLLTPVHPLDPAMRRAKWEAAKPISIGSNVWIGGGAIILGGVMIGDDSVIGAGSVVTNDIPAGVVAVGNPARVQRSV